MTKETEFQKLKSEYPDFFKIISPEIIDFAFSEKTSSQISNICLEGGLKEEDVDEVSYRVALVFFNKLPRESLVIALKDGVGLPPETAQKISSEVNRLIFSQMPRAQVEVREESTTSIKEQTKEEEQEKPAAPPASSKPDTYREPVE